MTEQQQDALWLDFPKTAIEFEAKFATEEDCRAYWMQARWGGPPSWGKCASTHVRTEREGTRSA